MTADAPPVKDKNGQLATAPFFSCLYLSDGPPRPIRLDDLGGCASGDDSLLWVDLTRPDEALLGAVWRACAVPAQAQAVVAAGTSPMVGQDGDFFWVRCIVVNDACEKENMSGSVLWCVAGPNLVVSIHEEPIAFLQQLKHQARADVAIGGLCAESFVATLLDRQLATYFKAVSNYESAIERLENDILTMSAHASLPELQRLRKWASRMRRMLAPHRDVFGVMSRPDFRPGGGRSADRHFVALDTRFERAMDMVENARELVIGSFGLFSSQTALRTNDSMRVLTFATVIIGLLATLVGALGMNFDAHFFKSQDLGFWLAIAGLGCIALGALALARWRQWF